MNDFTQHRANAAMIDVVVRAKKLLRSRDPKVRALVKLANEELLNLKHLTPGAVHQDSMMSQLSVQYRNEIYIGEQLMPVVTVGKPSDKYWKYGKRDRLAAPDDNVSVRGTVNEVGQETRATDNYSCISRALKDYIPERTLQAQDAGLDEMADMIAGVNEAINLNRELRISSIMTTAANFSGNTVTLAGASQWNDVNSDPYADITTGRNACWNGLNGATRLLGYCGLGVYNTLRRHPKIVADFKHIQGLKLPTRQQLAEYLELDDLLVGMAWQDTANIGVAQSLARIWGKHFGMARVATTPTRRSAHFGSTFRNGSLVTTQWYDAAPGVEGGWWGKVGLEEDHKIVAPDTGYLIVNAIA